MLLRIEIPESDCISKQTLIARVESYTKSSYSVERWEFGKVRLVLPDDLDNSENVCLNRFPSGKFSLYFTAEEDGSKDCSFEVEIESVNEVISFPHL